MEMCKADKLDSSRCKLKKDSFALRIGYSIVSKNRKVLSQLAIAFSKLTIETLEQGVKYVQSYQ